MRDISTKINNGGATADGRLEASEYNDVQLDIENGVIRSGQVLNAADTLQMARQSFLNSVGAQSFIDSGTTNAIVLTPTTGASGYVMAENYAQLNGARILCRVAATNTGAVTVNIGQTAGTLLGVKNLVDLNGLALTSGFYKSGDLIELQYRASSGNFILINNIHRINAVFGSITGKNLLINCNFAVNQLVKTGTVTLADGQYGHDGFLAVGGACTYTFSKSNNITTITITSGYLAQKVDPDKVGGGTIVLGWAGTAQAKIDDWPLTGLPLASGPLTKSVTGGASLACVWGPGTLSLPKLEAGYNPTAFEFNSFNEDLFQCMPYCQKSYNQEIAPGYIGGAVGEFGFGVWSGSQTNTGSKWSHAFPVPMHAAPTLTLYSNSTGASGVIYSLGAASDVTPILSTLSKNSFTIDALTGVTTTDQRFSGQFLAEARL
jgi:hypothetical protein